MQPTGWGPTRWPQICHNRASWLTAQRPQDLQADPSQTLRKLPLEGVQPRPSPPPGCQHCERPASSCSDTFCCTLLSSGRVSPSSQSGLPCMRSSASQSGALLGLQGRQSWAPLAGEHLHLSFVYRVSAPSPPKLAGFNGEGKCIFPMSIVLRAAALDMSPSVWCYGTTTNPVCQVWAEPLSRPWVAVTEGA